MSHKSKNERAKPAAPETAEAPRTESAQPGAAPEQDAPAALETPEQDAPAALEQDPRDAENAALKDRLARLMADFDNYRKRQIREHSELVKRANENLLEDLLPFLDTLDLALANGGADDPFVKGVRMAADQLNAILAKCGMKPVDASAAFDPNLHEAVAQMPSDAAPEGGIIAQPRRGWTLNGRLLRAAQVVVSAGAPEDKEAGEA